MHPEANWKHGQCSIASTEIFYNTNKKRVFFRNHIVNDLVVN